MVERFVDKIHRHLGDKDFSIQTLASGLIQGLEWIASTDVSHAEVGKITQTENYQSQKDLTRFRIPLKMKGIPGIKPFLSVLTFPEDSYIDCHVKPESEEIEDCQDILNKYPAAFVAFDGPTMLGRYPNNGTYFEGIVYRDFAETNPPGERRGAMAFYKDGSMAVIDDKKKWELITTNSEEVRALIGTSTYFDSSDSIFIPDINRENERSRVSYILEFIDKNGKQRFGYMISKSMVTRTITKLTLDELLKREGWQNYRVAELELVHSTALIRHGKIKSRFASILNDGDTGHMRRDSYAVFRK